jgi:hypothetical protein
MQGNKSYRLVFFTLCVGVVTIFCSQPCVADSPRIDCAIEPSVVQQGGEITIKVESEEELKSLRVFLKQPKISGAPLVVQNMIGRKCIAVDMERAEGNQYVGRVKTCDLAPGEAIVKTYATNLNKEHATNIAAVKIK